MSKVRGQKRIDTIVSPLNLVLLLNSVLWLKYNQRRILMKKARFAETQILRVLKKVEKGRQVKDVCSENGVSEASYYN